MCIVRVEVRVEVEAAVVDDALSSTSQPKTVPQVGMT